MIERETAATLYEIYERALRTLGEAEPLIQDIGDETTRLAFVSGQMRVVADILSKLRAPLVMQYRDFDTEVHEGPPDTLLEPDEQELVDKLTPALVQRIDEILLSDCVSHWRKVARVAGKAWLQLSDESTEVPLAFCAQRVKALVASGRLQAQGNLDHIGFSEVRLPYDPLADIDDESLAVDEKVMHELSAFRHRAKLIDLPGVDPTTERERLSGILNSLADTLLEGIEANPNKRWVMGQFQRSLVLVEQEDTEAREHFGTELESLMDILGIESSDGLLAFYLGGL